MNPVMYILMDPSVPMSTGKRAAQAGHAAVEAYRLSCKQDGGNFQETSIANRWRLGGHYAKIVLQTDDLLLARNYILDRGFSCNLIIDEGRTEFNNDLTATALGVEIVDKDQPHVRETFGAFKLYQDNDRRVPPSAFERLKRALRS